MAITSVKCDDAAEKLLDILEKEDVRLSSGEDGSMAWKMVSDLFGQLHEDRVVFEASFELVQEILSIGFMNGDTHVEVEATAGLGDVLENFIGKSEWRARFNGG